MATLVSVLQKPSGEWKKVFLNLCMKVGIFHKWVPLQCLQNSKTGPSDGQPHTKTWKFWGIQGHNKNFAVQINVIKVSKLELHY